MLIYREEIDGLRAIAVLPVILYHAGFHRFFAGGYVGVDVFFVISGYLITSVIEDECDNQKFSLTGFYERRCRRILPALFLILFLSSRFAYYWMLPSQLIEFGQTLISINLFSSNFFFWWKDDGYFARLTELNPLVHTWSLAVEEQFYFVFPLLCYFFNQKKRQLISILVFVTVLSFFLAQWGGNLQLIGNQRLQMFSQHSWASFYSPVGRVWELLLGAFAAFYLRTNKQVRKLNRKWKQFLAFLGLAFIIMSVVLFDNHRIDPFPNCYTLLPTCGATLVILFGDESTLVGSFLSQRPLRWVGLISYSAYLWHQPLLAFLRLRFNESLPFSYIIIAISAVLPLSVFSYYFIEQPFRQKRRFSRKPIFICATVSALLTFILALFLIQTANTRSLLLKDGTDYYLSDLKQSGNMYYTMDSYRVIDTDRPFPNRTSSAKNRIVLIGDSYSQDFYNIIREGKYLLNYELRVHYVHTDCQIYMGAEDRQKFILPVNRQKCTDTNDIKYALSLIREADIVILAACWGDWSAERLPTTINLLNLTEQQQVIVMGTKHFGYIDQMLYVNKTKEYRIAQYQHPEEMFVVNNRLLEQIINPSIFVNVMKMVCTGHNNTCPLFTRDGRLISYDGSHLTKYGAIYVGEIIFSEKPLSQL